MLVLCSSSPCVDCWLINPSGVLLPTYVRQLWGKRTRGSFTHHKGGEAGHDLGVW